MLQPRDFTLSWLPGEGKHLGPQNGQFWSISIGFVHVSSLFSVRILVNTSVAQAVPKKEMCRLL